ncbi:DMT family transporter [Jannaschia sp. LMIT008]|uniref:DMT family transporter n=1 Tax=Jannaschia maritima TaxID=3032585 RepID=UPI002811BCB4|nr:DMT family transporter [Jannaschia sp. LMIT008]
MDDTRRAAAMVLAAMGIIGFIDQFVVLIAQGTSLWTFHVLRSAMMWALALGWLAWRGRGVRIVSLPRIAARAAFMATGMVVYFGALGFMPVAQAAAGLFTAPIWVLLYSALLFGHRVGIVRILAVLAGFGGVLLVLSPDPATLRWAAVVPVAAGVFYGMAAILTREWCAAEDPVALALGVFAALAAYGVAAMVLLPAGGTGFLDRGWVPPDAGVWGWIAVQAIGSLVAVVLLTRAYQTAETARVAVVEYSVLGYSVLFGWLIWAEGPGAVGLAGLAMIVASGAVVTLRADR